MGARGPLPKERTMRRNQRPEPAGAVPVERPRRPKSLAGEARAEWNRVVPILEDMGVLARVDRGILIRYCQAWADWCELNENLQKTGKLVRGQQGNLVRNPLWLMRSDAERTVTDLARQLGLTPMTRLRNGITHTLPVIQAVDTGGRQQVADFEAERRRRLAEAD